MHILFTFRQSISIYVVQLKEACILLTVMQFGLMSNALPTFGIFIFSYNSHILTSLPFPT